jgi:AcrR family transcriptional regulator
VTTPPRPLRADARRNYERLVEAASVAFTTRGADASLDEIAKQAGVGSGTLYRHFPTRSDLLVAVYQDRIRSISDSAYELLDTKPPGEALVAWMRALVTHVAGLRGLKEVMAAVLEDGNPVMAGCHGLMRDAADALLTAAKAAGEVRADLEVNELLRLTHAVAVTSEVPATSPFTAPNSDRLLSLVLEGLGPARPAGG